MEQFWQNHRTTLIALGIAIIAFFSTVFVVKETQQAVIIRNGEPVGTLNRYNPARPFSLQGAGIWYHIPFIDRVQIVDRRILNLGMEPQQVLSKDQQRLQVDAYARFRIVDPVRMVQRARTEENLQAQLKPILSSALRQELGRRNFSELLTAERGTAMLNVRNTLNRQAQEYGADIIDVRIKQADLPAGSPLETAFTRMQTDREAEADTIKARGGKDAQIIQAEAEAEAARIYADAYGKDPQFYDFYRAMQSYRTTFDGKGQSSVILSPDNEYLRQFRGQR